MMKHPNTDTQIRNEQASESLIWRCSLTIFSQCFFIAVFSGCMSKSPAEEIAITNIEGHRKFQNEEYDKIVKGDVAKGFRRLRGMYRELGTEENINTPEYNYYMARVYGLFNNMPLSPDFYDSVNHKMLLPDEYTNIYDSLFYFTDRLSGLSQYPVVSAALMAEGLYSERRRYSMDQKTMPYPSFRNRDLYEKRLGDLVNNSLSYYEQDTSQNKVRSRVIMDFSFDRLMNSVDFKNPTKDDNNLNMLAKMFEMWSIMDKHRADDPVLISWNYRVIKRQDLPVMKYGADIVKKRQAEYERRQFLSTVDIRHKYTMVDLEGGVSAMMEFLSDFYTQVATSGDFQMSGRGDYTREGNFIFLNRTSGITAEGRVRIEVGDDNRIMLVLENGTTYIQDDELEYVKQQIPTPRYGRR